LVLERVWGKEVSSVVTVLIIITAFASVFAGLLGGSRVPYNAARDGVFLRQFGTLHPRLHIPHRSLLVMGVITAIGSFFDLSTVINMLIAVIVLIQGIGQVVALMVLRYRQPELRRPYHMWLYPVPGLIALIGWVYVYYASGWQPILLSLGWLVIGAVAFLIWARVEQIWPFGPKEIKEAYIEEQVGEIEGAS
jgi:amino acid transporter